jgi:hypothetical protein
MQGISPTELDALELLEADGPLAQRDLAPACPSPPVPSPCWSTEWKALDGCGAARITGLQRQP